ncbi:hypothetical protein ACN2WE_05195 [Streptomyces sp. cg28]|uniref:hypothetical protein n=1 Tax=Streptomyces sp. cg28 TaxID=3403457 RepID=UPI003B21359F
MTRRRTKKPDANDEQELGIAINPFTQLPETTVQPRTTPIPAKPRRPWGRKK